MERANEIGLGCRLKERFLPWTNFCHSSIHAWICIFAQRVIQFIYQKSRKFLFYKVTGDNGEVSKDQILAFDHQMLLLLSQTKNIGMGNREWGKVKGE